MFIIPSIDLSMKLSLSEVFVSNIIVTMVISNKSCCKHVLFTNLSDFISTTTRVTSLKSKKFLFCSFSVAKFGIAPPVPHNRYHKAKLPTTHPQVLELCIVLGKCLRGIASVTHPPTPITITTQPHKYWN